MSGQVLRYRAKTLRSSIGAYLLRMSLFPLLSDVGSNDRDPRNPAAPLRRHAQAHSDDITSVRFSPRSSSLKLLSGSTDGLVCISDVNQEDEDEAVLNVGNWGCSVARAGWVHGSGVERAWARSDMETVSLWSDEVQFGINPHPKPPTDRTEPQSSLIFSKMPTELVSHMRTLSCHG